MAVRRQQNRITLRLEGLPGDEGHVRLEDFEKQLRSVRSSLEGVERLSVADRPHSYFRVVGLSHDSPATVELEACRVDTRQPIPDVAEEFFETVGRIDRGDVPSNLDAKTLQDLRGLVLPVGRRLRSVVVEYDNVEYPLSTRFKRNIEDALRDTRVELGTIEGQLERLNLHASANNFAIYPVSGPSRVTCHFPERLRAQVASAVDRRVAVHGEFNYLRNARFPHVAEVSSIDVYPENNELPSLMDLLGIAEPLDQRSEDIIRALRDGEA